MDHAKRCCHSLSRMFGIGQGRAEDGHDGIANELVDHTTMRQNNLADFGKIGV